MEVPLLLIIIIGIILNECDAELRHHAHDIQDDSYYISFQPDGKVSNETYASYSGTFNSEIDRMTICYWIKLHYHHYTMSVVSYCAPVKNCTPIAKKTECSNIQYHAENNIWDELRVEFSLESVKTKSLKAQIIPKQWNHHCLTYSHQNGVVSMFSGGKKQNDAILQRKDKNISHPKFPAEGKLILGQEQEKVCGEFDDYDSLSADISEFQVWDRVLDNKEIRALATCQSFQQGNVFSWHKSKFDWKLSRIQSNNEKQNKLKAQFCNSLETEKKYIVFPDMNIFDMALYICKIHGGTLPVPKNSMENLEMAALGKKYEPVCSDPGKANLDQPYMWLGIHDPQGSGTWRVHETNEPIKFSNWDEHEGDEGDTCARMLGNGIWRDTMCKKSVQHCTTCDIKASKRVFTLRGLCEETQIDRGYFLINGKPEDKETSRMRPSYEGHFSLIKWVEDSPHPYRDDHQPNTSGYWLLSSRIGILKKDVSAYSGVPNDTSSNLGYPVGRHLWIITDPKCNMFSPTSVNLTLSICNENEFTCDDGSCINADQRCDLVPNCNDYSDELNCETVIVPSTYLHNPPTYPNQKKPVSVSQQVNILNIDKIDTVNMMLALTMEVSWEWKDHRLKYKNLKKGLSQNHLTQNEIDNIWKPTVSFTNARIGQLRSKEMGLMVRRESEPLKFSYSDPVEDKIYSGEGNSLVLVRKYYAEYSCTFYLQSFPFDDQKCTMNFTMDSAKADYIVLKTENITYQGEILLLEFLINKIYADNATKITESGKSLVSIYITFHRELGNMVNTYFQTFLLCLMAYLTLYINLADFANRFMGALTSLLVLASLLASIEENLPKTSYFKKIDIWFMSYIIFIFTIIVFHICIDYCTGHRQELIDNTDTHVMARVTKIKATYYNNVGKVIFPIIVIVFSTLYFVLSLI